MASKSEHAGKGVYVIGVALAVILGVCVQLFLG